MPLRCCFFPLSWTKHTHTNKCSGKHTFAQAAFKWLHARLCLLWPNTFASTSCHLVSQWEIPWHLFSDISLFHRSFMFVLCVCRKSVWGISELGVRWGIVSPASKAGPVCDTDCQHQSQARLLRPGKPAAGPQRWWALSQFSTKDEKCSWLFPVYYKVTIYRCK